MCGDPNSVICQKWTQLGGDTGPGATVMPAKATADGRAVIQVFQYGAIFHTPEYGTCYMPKAFYERWLNRTIIEPWPGYPLRDAQLVFDGKIIVNAARPEPDRLVMVDCEFASLVTKVTVPDFAKTTGVVILPGPMALCYRDAKKNGQGGPSGFLGPPLDLPQGEFGGTRLDCQHGTIWASDAGAFAFPASAIQVLRRHHATNLGMPTSAPTGTTARFQNGNVYAGKGGKAWAVFSPIAQHYESGGGPTGELGMPAGDRTFFANGEYQNFDKGVVVRLTAGDLIGMHTVTTLRFYLDKCAAMGGDEISSLGLDMYVNGNLWLNRSTGESLKIFSERFPGGGGYFSAEGEIKRHWNIGPIRGGDVLHLTLEGKEDDTGADDVLGTVTRQFGAATLWDVKDLDGFQLRHDAFKVWGAVSPENKPVNWSKFRDENTWAFDNIAENTISWPQYAHAFTDVDDDMVHSAQPLHYVERGWQHIFYSSMIEDFAEDGLCYGMAAELGRVIANQSPFVQPVTNYQRQHVLDTLCIRHAQQIGHRVIQWFISQFPEQTWDPVRVFNETKAAFDKGELPIIAVTKPWFQAGHVVFPYAFQKNGSDWRIKIANPSFPKSQATDTDAVSEIRINASANTFSLGPDYTGGHMSGGLLYHIPFSRYASAPRTPCYETLAALVIAGTLICLADDGSTQQISRGGKATYKTEPGEAPTRWDQHVAGKAADRGATRLPVLAGGAWRDIHVLPRAGAGEEVLHTVQLPASGKPVRWLAATPGFQAALQFAAGPAATARVSVATPPGRWPTFKVQMTGAAAARGVTIGLHGPSRLGQPAWSSLDGLQLASGEQLALQVLDAGGDILLSREAWGRGGVPRPIEPGPAIRFRRKGLDRMLAPVPAGRSRIAADASNAALIPGEVNSLRRSLELRGLPGSGGLRAMLNGANPRNWTMGF